MNLRALGYAAAACAAVFACNAFGAAGPPLASVWNIAPTGSAESSGELIFRVTPNDGSDPIEVTVSVLLGAKQDAIARDIRNTLSTRLPRQNYDVELGAGTNVLVSDPRGRPNFSLELLDSDLENVRVAVQSVTPSAAPTTPAQTNPAAPPPVVTPPPANEPGNAGAPPPTSAPAPGNTAPVPNQNLPPPGAPTPVPNQNLPTPGAPTPAPGTPSAPQGTTSPTPSPAPNAPAPGGAAPAPGGRGAATPGT